MTFRGYCEDYFPLPKIEIKMGKKLSYNRWRNLFAEFQDAVTLQKFIRRSQMSNIWNNSVEKLTAGRNSMVTFDGCEVSHLSPYVRNRSNRNVAGINYEFSIGNIFCSIFHFFPLINLILNFFFIIIIFSTTTTNTPRAFRRFIRRYGERNRVRSNRMWYW